jgi:O-antigen/teichoic acid export membrane protein
MSYTKKAVRGTIILFVMMVLAAGLGYLIRLFLARNLTQEEYGLFYSVFALITFLALFRNLGLGEALTKKISELNIKKDYPRIKGAILFILMIQLISSFIICVTFFILADYLAIHYFHSPAAATVLRILIIAFFLSALEYMYSFIFAGFQKMEYLSLIDFIRNLFIIILIYILFIYNKSVLVPSYANLISYFIVVMLYLPLLLKIFPDFFRTKMKFDKKIAKGMIKFGVYSFLGVLGLLILGYADTLLLTYFTDLKQVALYNVAVPLISLLWFFSRAVSLAIYPISSELWAKKHKDFSKGIEKLQRYSFLIIIPLALTMFSFPDIIIRILFGETYVPAQYALQILSIGAIFYTVMTINNHILMAIGKVKQNTYYLLIGGGVNLLLNFILIPLYGILGAATATSLSYLLVLVLTTNQIKHLLKNQLSWQTLFKTFLAGFFFIIVIYVLKRVISANIYIEIILCLGSAIIVYLLFVFLLRLASVNEIKEVSKTLISKS